jgi:hypothetical protein
LIPALQTGTPNGRHDLSALNSKCFFDNPILRLYCYAQYNRNIALRMRQLLYKLAIIAGGLVLLRASTALAEEKKVNLGVSIPAATHGRTGGVVFRANQAKKELEQANPGLGL